MKHNDVSNKHALQTVTESKKKVDFAIQEIQAKIFRI